jgi:hypothetical protein
MKTPSREEYNRKKAEEHSREREFLAQKENL